MARGFSIRAFLGLDTKQFTRGMKGARGKLTNFQKGLRGINDTLRGLKFAAIGVTAVGAFSRAVNTLKDFQTNMARVKVITEASEGTMLRMTEAARKIGAETRFSASEAASGLQFLGMAGLDAEKSLEALPATLDLAGAGMIGVGRSADIVTNVLAGFNLAANEAALVSDVFAQASRKSNQNIEELYEGLKLIAPAYNSLGLTVQDATVDMALLANSGIKAEQAGTALAGALSRLLRQPPLVANALKALGVEVTESKLKQEGLIGVIKELRDAGINTAQMTEILGLHWKTAGALISKTDEQIEKLASDMSDVTGVSNKMSREGIGGIEKAIKLLNSAIDELIISFGYDDGLAGLLEGVILKARSMITWFTNLSKGAKIFHIAMLYGIVSGKKYLLQLVRTVGALKLTRMGFLRAAVSARTFFTTLKLSSGLIGAILIAIEGLVLAMSSYKSEAEKTLSIEKDLNKYKENAKTLTKEDLNKELALTKIQKKRAKDRVKSLQKEVNAIDFKTAAEGRDLAVLEQYHRKTEELEKAQTEYYKADEKFKKSRQEQFRRNVEARRREEEATKKASEEVAKQAEKEAAAKAKEASKLREAISLRNLEKKSLNDISEAIKIIREAAGEADKDEAVFLQARIGLLEKEKKLREDIAKPFEKIKSRGTEGVQHGLKKEIDLDFSKIDSKALVGLETINESLRETQALLTELKYGGGVMGALGLGEEHAAAAEEFNKTMKGMEGSMEDLASSGIDNFKDLGDAMGNMIRKTVSDAIGAYVAQFVAGVLAGANLGLFGLVAAPAIAAVAQTTFNSLIPAFATGGIQGIPNGIVPGTSLTGDNNIARVNSREMVLNMAQQRNLFDIANRGGLGGNGRVEFEVKGDKLVGVLNNTKTKNRRF